MIEPIYVVMEKIDNNWVPAIGGGSSTKPSIRAFDNLTSANRSLIRLNHMRGSHGVDGERQVMKFEVIKCLRIMKHL